MALVKTREKAVSPREAAARYRAATDQRVSDLIRRIGDMLSEGEFTIADDLETVEVMGEALVEFVRAGWKVEAARDLACLRLTPAEPIAFQA